MRNSRDELRGRLLAIFREEAADHLRSVAGGMAAIEGAGDGSAALGAVDGLFRTVHTLKGAARSLSITSIETICHDIEDHCSALVQGRASMDADARQMLRALTDRLAEVTTVRLAEIATPPPAAVVPAPPAPAATARAGGRSPRRPRARASRPCRA
jgi:two-component system chemotaxis sensor kinase CheA